MSVIGLDVTLSSLILKTILQELEKSEVFQHLTGCECDCCCQWDRGDSTVVKIPLTDCLWSAAVTSTYIHLIHFSPINIKTAGLNVLFIALQKVKRPHLLHSRFEIIKSDS